MSTEWKQPETGSQGPSTRALGPPAGDSRAGQWSVSTRSIGEVLTTEIRSDGLRLLLFTGPSEETARQIEGRLEELLATDSIVENPLLGMGAVPAPLQYAVDVLLELTADVERVTQRRAGALALYQSAREVACSRWAVDSVTFWRRSSWLARR